MLLDKKFVFQVECIPRTNHLTKEQKLVIAEALLFYNQHPAKVQEVHIEYRLGLPSLLLLTEEHSLILAKTPSGLWQGVMSTRAGCQELIRSLNQDQKKLTTE